MSSRMQEAIQSPGFPVPVEINVSNSTPYSGPSCPQTHDCDNIAGYVSFDIGRAPSYVAITSSGLSCIGSFLVIATFLLLKDMRTGSQKIITFLAIADLISAVGYIFGSINFLVYFNETDTHVCYVFDALCRTQASITSWSSLCSFCWTIILAFYFYMVIVYNRKAIASRLVPLYNIIAWLCPLLVIVPLTAVGKLGYARYAASNWCFVKDLTSGATNTSGITATTNVSTGLLTSVETIAFIFVAGKLWEILTYIGVILIYAHIAGHLSRVLSHSILASMHVHVSPPAPCALQIKMVCQRATSWMRKKDSSAFISRWKEVY